MQAATEARSTEAKSSDAAAEGVTTLVSQWFSATAAQGQALIELASAEAKLAASSVGLMVVFAVLAAVFVLGAWGLVVAGLVLAAIGLGVPLWGALLLLGGLHVVAAALLWRAATGLTEYVEFKATRTELQRVAPREKAAA